MNPVPRRKTAAPAVAAAPASAAVPGDAAPAQPAAFDRLLADLSAGFVNIPPDRVDGAITDALRGIATLLGVDRTQLIRFTSGSSLRVTHSGAIRGVAEGAPAVDLARAFPWAVGRLHAGLITQYESLESLPSEASIDRITWQRYGVKSELIVPLPVDGQVDGAVVLDCDRAHRSWPADLVERMQVLATILGSALAHKRSREALDAAMRFERTTSEVMARLLAAPPADQDRVLETGLSEVAEALGADRVTLWQRRGDSMQFAKTHRWMRGDLPAPVPGADTRLPWIHGELVLGRTVRFTRLLDLPREAADDVETLRGLHIGAALVVPLSVQGQVSAALSLATQHEGVDWPDALLDRARLLGEALAGFVALQESQGRELEAQAQAMHAARVGSMGVFAASLVHELTQPLTASLANAETTAELLAAPQPDLRAAQATVADLLADSRRAAELVQKLRRFLRHGADERHDVDTAALLVEVQRFAAAEARSRGIDLEFDVAPGLPTLVGDRVQLQQLLLNLLLNAFDAVAGSGPGARRVRVRAGAGAEGLRLEVADRGVGMDAQALQRIFQPFFTTKAGGMGLGLSIARSIAAAHGGALNVRSAPGEGTTFEVDLPAGPQPQPAAPRMPVLALGDAGTVYLIDDDDRLRSAVERQLVASGYRVEAFGDAHAFLDRASQADPACLVCDLQLPGLGGLELQAELARRRPDLPIVFISGQADVPSTARAMRGGAVAFLAKPFAHAELLAAVSEALALSRRRTSERNERAALRRRLDLLTAREHEVFELVVSGLPNKLVARRLEIAEPTVKIHRRRVMDKLGAATLADLMQIKQALAEAGK